MTIILLSLTAIVWIFILIETAIGLKRLPSLDDEPIQTKGPLLSVIVAARNEQDHLESSILSQLTQSYQNVEWILVNDRSTDETGLIMEKLAAHNPRIKVVHIKSLLEGWLGKNHALYVGTQMASGELLLFTDADVRYNKDAFAKAIHYFLHHQLDHLTAAPGMKGTGIWLKAFIAFFLFGFSYYKRPWRANNPRSKVGIGIGAFNLIAKSAYQAFGTHEKIKMRPDDDLQLGIKIKQAGFKQQFVTALSLIKVEWYTTLKEAFIGLEKNTFAGLHYRFSMVVFAIIGTFLSQVFPFIMLLSNNHTVFTLSILNILLLAVLYTIIATRTTQFSPLLFILFPISALIFIYAIARASFLTFKRGGIVWRGTTYSLADLRRKESP
ncbi:glycosyltransferase [Bacillus aquiflavi]|uniref:4,4'-diaponeurosporenoate glycosyltransferase n=1 Tax=Bacillus aquiflavi TaxID=2672567 RepID=A0A6B3W3K7_9BACI|nr:glycosyltransferase family 2 protein [Bacillus aquiflavi]MBA4538204.1 glycosyltransferase [Bacillus aquiflavi]NEY82523.1 glycosyltransferase [Bacillus aquiflavi]UAC50053.1 glycosyltransferase family 2 protein [Bacillus aquiflavi]